MPLSLDNFIDIKEVGSGTSAAVFSATRKKGGQAVALKRTLITSQAARVAAHREYSLLEQFPHLHLVETRDSFEHTYPDGSTYHFTVLELALRDLSFLLGPKAPRDGSNFATLLRYCAELLLAIEHLHSFKITHRDIKLANCFLRVSGELILGDLGSSRVYGGDGSLTIVGASDAPAGSPRLLHRPPPSSSPFLPQARRPTCRPSC